MEKRQLRILAVAGAILLVAVVFIIVRRQQAANTVTVQASQLSGQSAGFPFTADGKTLYFVDRTTSRFAVITLPNGSPRFLSRTVQYPTQVSWSPTGDQVIFATTNLPSATTDNPFFVADRSFGSDNFWLLNFQSGKLTLLKEHLGRVIWFPSGKKILYQYLKSSSASELDIANPDGTQQFKLKDFTRADPWFATVDEQRYVYSETYITNRVTVSTLAGFPETIAFPAAVDLQQAAQGDQATSWFYATGTGAASALHHFDTVTKKDTTLAVKGVTLPIGELATPDGRQLFFTQAGSLYSIELSTPGG